MWQFEHLDGVGEGSVDQGSKVMRIVHARKVDARVAPVAHQAEKTVQPPSRRAEGEPDAGELPGLPAIERSTRAIKQLCFAADGRSSRPPNCCRAGKLAAA
ncbi:hypothetical protein [Sorangium sp. So ce854]|uniref:hypothetical protein n=1 Tax=Sorangium sp. So ce854 TaxID=3133322 RepID=UPI003F635048